MWARSPRVVTPAGRGILKTGWGNPVFRGTGISIPLQQVVQGCNRQNICTSAKSKKENKQSNMLFLRNFNMIIALMALIYFSSCDKNKERLDGDWEEMKWEKVSYTTEKYQGYTCYKVPKEGGTYSFKCKNYPNFWLCNVLVVEPDKETYYAPHEDDLHKLECEVVSVNVEKQVVTITIAPLSEYSSRVIRLYVTGGDIFDIFSFIQ